MNKRFMNALKAAIGDSHKCYGIPGKVVDGGSLTVAGSGIGSRDLLCDLPGLMAQSDHVMICIADQVTQRSVYEVCPFAIDLTRFYEDGQNRHSTYLQMAEMMVAPARNGKKVLAIFYGHPGFFASATHRAIGVARNEGIPAYMRPGISALDYLVADLGFDPAFPGMASFEATDLLMRNRPLDPTVHNVIWQVGIVGQAAYQASGFNNRGLSLLKNHMRQYYSNDHVVTNYIGARFAGTKSIALPFTIHDMDAPQISAQISAYSTLYVPPSFERPYETEACIKLGWVKEGQSLPLPDAYKTNVQYSENNLEIFKSSVETFSARVPNPSDENPFYQVIKRLNSDPIFSRWYEVSPEDAVASMNLKVSDEDRGLLVSRDFRRIGSGLYRYEAKINIHKRMS